ncbi:MAG TPA: 3-dehydro-L-gulonate 2-dehydrogenase [Terriglobales bacterium]|nr:3-dehydro-L-gulonate 2-dehydrogenase [Terriglobales bacterium]
MNGAAEIRVPYEELQSVLSSVLIKLGFAEDRARLSARLFADASRDGVQSHGLNRFPRFVRGIRSGLVDPQASPRLVSRFGAFERWDGQRGPGNLNAYHSMQRAIEMSHEHGIACVGLRNTNHWMRGGNYGWQAAEAGVIGICWTNTMPNLPPWGAIDPRLGNSPIIFAVPRREGHVVLDMAVSQFSYGAIESYRLKGKMLPVPGGFTQKGELTSNPAEIERSKRPLPIGYWKGSGLALMLDMMASMLSAGKATHEIPSDSERETSLSQLFIAIDPAVIGAQEDVVDRIIADLHKATCAGDSIVRFPGEQVLRIRRDSMERGILVNASIWNEVQSLVASIKTRDRT